MQSLSCLVNVLSAGFDTPRGDPLKVIGCCADAVGMGILGIALSALLAVAALDALCVAARGVAGSLRS
jgi:hypothetical protein